MLFVEILEVDGYGLVLSGNTGRGFEYSVPIVKSYHSSETLSKCVEQLFKIKNFFTNLDTNNDSRKGRDEHYSSLKFKIFSFGEKQERAVVCLHCWILFFITWKVSFTD